ncbi:MAG: bifunctional phosphoserine phosphatase/homoserine phosphotransferase ThrH [Spirochaetales bacterium]|nr:bifunctional phosphoserine phosphatase/homoserine phosphotransferase ThrH [Spirochaetales bacterium]
MHLVCLDLEGVLVPEIWINVALATGIEELKLTTRDISDYDVLMKKRIGILDRHNLKLKDIQRVIGGMDPLEGAKEFLNELRSLTQVVILSDTFDQFARPLMEKLQWPTLFCNTLIIDGSGAIADYRLRQKDGKRKAVEAFKTIGLSVIASGDSYNDITMLKTADAGVLFRPPENVKAEFPELPAVETYGDLLKEIQKHL